MRSIERAYPGCDFSAAATWSRRDAGQCDVIEFTQDSGLHVGTVVVSIQVQHNIGRVLFVHGARFMAGRYAASIWPLIQQLARMSRCVEIQAMSARHLDRLPGVDLKPVATLFHEAVTP